MNTIEICRKLATFLTKFIILESLVTNLREPAGCERDAIVSTTGEEINLTNEGRGELLPEERSPTTDAL
jgi:hypothetical protein